MQIIKGTQLARIYQEHPFPLYTVDEYIRLISEYIQRLRPNLILERFVSQSPANMLVAPHWGLKNYEFTHRLIHFLNEKGTYQGAPHWGLKNHEFTHRLIHFLHETGAYQGQIESSDIGK